MKHSWVCYALLAGLVAAAGCQSKKTPAKSPLSKRTQPGSGTLEAKQEPKQVTVQHVLIGFQGSIPGKQITRTREKAKTLAEDILKRARNGEEFGELVKKYTDDSFPGIYKIANFGMPADPAHEVWARSGMVPAFGDVGFPLAVGEVGMAEYDQKKSPYGWHIIKRVE